MTGISVLRLKSIKKTKIELNYFKDNTMKHTEIMNHVITLLVALILVLALSANVNASIIDNGNHVTVDGVEWLDLTETDGWTYNQTLALTGYHVASFAEFSAMFSQFADPTDQLGIDIVSNGPCFDYGTGARCDSVGDTGFTDNLFSQYFGATNEGINASLHSLYSYGFYADGTATRLGGIASADRSDPLQNDFLFEYYARTNDYEHIANGTTQWDLSGWFMVQDSPTTSDVPEPSTFAIFSLALIGIGFARNMSRRT